MGFRLVAVARRRLIAKKTWRLHCATAGPSLALQQATQKQPGSVFIWTDTPTAGRILVASKAICGRIDVDYSCRKHSPDLSKSGERRNETPAR
jgi:hypothetical protein